ncbi:hypothetical protein HK102_001423 [Quaeritorhiza haematococci]|nr:hypothetical protein HK102_001423 [Quaeritorhiza haematococci]
MSANEAGHIGNLNSEQLEALRQFYSSLFAAMDHIEDSPSHDSSSVHSASSSASAATKKSKFGLFGGSRKEADVPAAPAPNNRPGHGLLKFDKFSPATSKMRALEEFTRFAGYAHPDVLCLRFLRARKFDVEKAVTMCINCIKWRQEYGVGRIVFESEAVLDPRDYEAGKGFFCGFDNQGRPVQYVQVRLHDKNARDLQKLQNFVVWSMETGQLLFKDAVENATIVFDMGGFSINKSMDYEVVKFLTTCLESYYPESLGQMFIVNAPFIFNGCWQVIRPWIDPVVASKIKFCKASELSQYMPEQYIPKSLNPKSSSAEEFRYVSPSKEEQAKLAKFRSDIEARKAAIDGFQAAYMAFAERTAAWCQAGGADAAGLKEQREESVRQMQHAYGKLSPYVRSPTHYHRIGMASDSGLNAVLRA